MKKRNVNIELLRILSMIMIVYHHFNVHSQWNFPDELSKRTILIQSFGDFGKIGVIIFILITGYFFANQTFSFKKIFNLSNIVRFYSLLAMVIFIFTNGDVPREMWIQNVFPVIFQKYWFVTAYILLLLIQPILKGYFLHSKINEQLKHFIILIGVLYIPGIAGMLLNTEKSFRPDTTIAFIVIAFAGHLIHQYNQVLREKYFKIVVSGFLLSFLLILLRPIIVYYLSDTFYLTGEFLIGINSLNALIFSASLFVIVQKLKIPDYKLITMLSPLVFDVYLIHDNFIIRPLLWVTLFKNATLLFSNWLPIIVIFEPLVVFVVCLIVAKIRAILFNGLDKLRIRLKKILFN